MCSPGISSLKTDEQLASDLRRHAQAILSAKQGLVDRGYAVGCFVTDLDKIIIKKEVQI